MVLHRVCAWRDWKRDQTILYNSLTNCFTIWAMAELTAIWRLGCGRKRNWEREGEVSEGVSLVTIQLFAWEKRFLWNHKVSISPYHVTFDLEPEQTLDTDQPADHPVQVWWWSSCLSGRIDLRKCLQMDARRTTALAHSGMNVTFVSM